MKRKVLIPLDGTELSRQVVPHVMRFFDPQRYEITLLRVGEPPPGHSAPPPRMLTSAWTVPMHESSQDARLALHPIVTSQEWDSGLAALEEEIRVDASFLRQAGYLVSLVARFGDPVEVITEYAERENVDLVAIATHGRSGLSRLLFGSVTEALLHRLSIPFMLVRPSEEVRAAESPADQLLRRLDEDKPVRLVVATDGPPHAAPVLAVAGQLTMAWQARETVLVALGHDPDVSHGRQALNNLAASVETRAIPPEVVPLVGYPDESVLRYLTHHATDLLVIGPFTDCIRTGRAAIGLTAHRLLLQSPTNILLAEGVQPQIRKVLVCPSVGEKTVVDVGIRIAKSLGAHLQLLQVLQLEHIPQQKTVRPEDAQLAGQTGVERRVRRQLAEDGATLEAVGYHRDAVTLRKGESVATILRKAREDKIDLIVVSSQGGRWSFLDTVADRVARYAEQSVLIVRTND